MSRKRSQEAIEPPSTSASSRGPRRRRGVERASGGAGLGADQGLLRLRLPEGALGRLRAARLPIGLAAGPPRPRVPLRAAERAADGLLPARLAGPRGAAARRPCRRRPTPTAADVLCRVERERGGLVVRVGLGYVKGVREEEMESLVAARERGGPYRGIADLASRSGAGRDGLERLAWAGALDAIAVAAERRGRRPPRGALAGRGRAPAATGCPHGEGAQLALPLEPPAAAAAGAPGRLGVDDRRLPLDRDGPRRAPDGADARRASTRACCAAPTSTASRTAARSRWRGWWSPASGPRPRRGSSSCCSRTSGAPST